MFEIQVTIKLPGIPEAINYLAEAIGGKAALPDAKDTLAAVPAEPAQTKAEVPVPAEPIKAQAKELAPAETPVNATEPEPSFIGNVPPDEEPAPAPAAAKKYTFKQISKAGAALCADMDKMEQLSKIVNEKYGVVAITGIPEARYDELAADLIALGATIEEE